MKSAFILVLILLQVTVALAQHEHHMPQQKAGQPGRRPSSSQRTQPVKHTTSPAKHHVPSEPANEHTHHQDQPTPGSDSTAVAALTESAPYTGDSVDVVPGRVVRYDLYVTDTMVSYTGRHRHAYAINGSIPAPVLTFTEGDTAEIYLHNKLDKEETSLHWHGVVLPNQADGVPLLTTARIRPGETHVYRFPVVQNGTYWYHSHSGLQEQSGMYGVLVFNKRGQPQQSLDKDYTLILSEWTDEMPMQVQRRLRTGNDWYAIKKGSTQSYSEAIHAGHFRTKVVNEWKRMKAMDVSDVYYNRFLINGRTEAALPAVRAGERVRLRVVNGGASSYFWLQYAGGKITVIGNDGNDMEPVEVDRLIIAPAETYDLLVSVPENRSYEFRATPEDRTGATSLWLGEGMIMPAPVLPRLNYFAGMKMMNRMMKMNGNMKDMGMQMHNRTMDMNMVMYPEMVDDDSSGQQDYSHAHGAEENMQATDDDEDLVSLSYDMLRSPVKTILPDGPAKTIHFTLTGNMNRYVWTLDNKTVKEADRIFIRRGEKVRMIITNNSMMRHPMHLHGHDFRVVNSHGDYAPLKNVIDIMPMETDTLEFAANQDGNWFFHCHILYHMMAGMGRVFRYDSSAVNPELPNAEKAYRQFRRHKDQSMKHLMVRAGLESNGSDGEAMISSDRAALQEVWHIGLRPEHGYESETNLGRYLGRNQWWFVYGGFDYHYKVIDPAFENGHGLTAKNIFGNESRNMFGQISNKANRKTVVVGMQYTLPLLFIADFRVDGNGKFRFQLGREDIPLTKRLRFNLMVNTDKEYMAGFRYIVNKWFAVSTHYDSDMGLGAGVTLTY